MRFWCVWARDIHSWLQCIKLKRWMWFLLCRVRRRLLECHPRWARSRHLAKEGLAEVHRRLFLAWENRVAVRAVAATTSRGYGKPIYRPSFDWI